MAGETFEAIAEKLQSELVEIILNNKEVNDYELIMYKYVFRSELKIPLQEDFGFQFEEGSFILYIIPDDLQFSQLRKLDDTFDEFKLTFMANDYNMIKLKLELSD